MIPVSAFLDKVKEIAARPLTYRTGGRGNDGTCDCIGLIMGALQELGREKYDMHSTNYFVRYQMESLEPVGIAGLRAGMILYKSREDTAQLNERYQPGGRYYTGDMLDYYHVGVVESVYPLVIVHCTESGNVNGITRDYKLGNWSHAGKVTGVSYDDSEGVDPVMSEAIVTAKSGSTVNLRSRPSKGGLLYARVPIGAKVSVIESAKNYADELWSKVVYNGVNGYMMSEYLQTEEEAQNQPPIGEDEVRIILPKNVAEALLKALTEVPS